MSPEQAAGRPADDRADQFARGLILYEMLTGRPAFREETVAEALTAIPRTEPVPITKRFSISLPPGYTVAADYRPAVAISPDGATIVHSGSDPDRERSLYVRAIGELEPHLLPGTDGGR